VAVDSNMTTAAGDNRNGVDPVDVFSVTIANLAAGETLIIGGLTVTADSAGATGAEVAEAIDNLSDNGTGDATGSTIATVTGNLTGFATADTSSATIVFTATTAGTAAPTAGGTGSGHTIVGGTGGTANNTAYGSGVLFYGSSTAPTRIDITSATNAAQAIAEIDRAIDGAAAERAKLGSFMSRLQHASDNLQNVATNTAASKSRVADADYANETTELARTQIISQASTAMLSQANQVKQSVLALLQ
jgi:flagellin